MAYKHRLYLLCSVLQAVAPQWHQGRSQDAADEGDSPHHHHRIEWCVQGLLGGIKDKQRKLQEAHERTKTVTRTGEMKGIRERMQVCPDKALFSF